jgi:glycerol-3-phosphate O-acyltransferase/dihydroxyacetone phosphate acyltransferase
LHVGDSIIVEKETLVIQSIVNDTELELKYPKEMNEPAPFKSMPHIDQGEMFSKVMDRLARGRCVGIFPEGGSHDRPEFLPLKAGFTIMALGAMAQCPGLNVTIVPCGLNYFHPDKFRSSVVIEFGEPIKIDPAHVEMYARGGEEKKKACDELLGITTRALKAVTVTVPDYEALMLIQSVRRLYKPTKMKLDLDQTVELTRSFAKGYKVFKDDPKIQQLSKEVAQYNKMLDLYGIADHQVKNVALGGKRALELFCFRLIILFFLILFAFPG